MTTPAGRAATLERILRAILPVLADPCAPPEAVAYARDVWAKLTHLIDNLHGAKPPKRSRSQNGRSPETPRPRNAGAHAREDPAAEIARLQRNAERVAAGFHKLRKGRHQCEATNRDGGQCSAPAIVGGSVCKRHGGGAPQVRVKAALFLLYEARSEAADALTAAMGTPGELQAVVAWSRADNAVKRAEASAERIRELRAELRRRKRDAGQAPMQ
jgi:hypothetical protein